MHSFHPFNNFLFRGLLTEMSADLSRNKSLTHIGIDIPSINEQMENLMWKSFKSIPAINQCVGTLSKPIPYSPIFSVHLAGVDLTPAVRDGK